MYIDWRLLSYRKEPLYWNLRLISVLRHFNNSPYGHRWGSGGRTRHRSETLRCGPSPQGSPRGSTTSRVAICLEDRVGCPDPRRPPVRHRPRPRRRCRAESAIVCGVQPTAGRTASWGTGFDHGRSLRELRYSAVWKETAVEMRTNSRSI